VSHHIKGETGGKKTGTEKEKAGPVKGGNKEAPKK
jgi:hypothetical protein